MLRPYTPATCSECKRTVLQIGPTAPYCHRCANGHVSRALAGERVELTDIEAEWLQLNYRMRSYWENRRRREG